ncbi:MAG: hypothetical protein EU549_02230 [Promethearchaeota archaeon]|nr:MAG: hypothetical protein EU549_02230 [Candidatus Lokiarchaeota archaeon]
MGLGGPSPIPKPPEFQTFAYVSIDAWTEPFILKNDGKEWRNIPYRTAPSWDACWDNKQNNGQGTLYPNVFSYSSIAAYNARILFMLSKNGSIYKSTDKGITWQKFGDLGYGNDSAWVSIAAANHRNHSYIYALYNNGTVVRTKVGTFQPQSWGDCNVPWVPDTSWVSISLDGNATAYTIRNFGFVSYKNQGGSWQSKGTVMGNKVHQDSSWVGISAYHCKDGVLTLRNDMIVDHAPAGSSGAFGNIISVANDSSYVSITQKLYGFLILKNNGEVYDGSPSLIGTVHGDTGFVDITHFIDNPPESNQPTTPINVKQGSTAYIDWILTDDTGPGNYSIIKNNITGAWFSWTNGTSVHYQINTTSTGIFNYTIQYNDSMNEFGIPNTVIVNVTNNPPQSSHPASETVVQNSNAFIDWILTDDVGTGKYRIKINGTPGPWANWQNDTAIHFPINTSNTGVFNYTIEYNDSYGNFGIADTVIITVNEPITPPIPSFMFYLVILGIMSLILLKKSKYFKF